MRQFIFRTSFFKLHVSYFLPLLQIEKGIEIALLRLGHEKLRRFSVNLIKM